jgi:sugar lactone lactonase YvrE
MERSLKFAGYEVEHKWGKGGHNGQHATEIFPEAVKWLWKDHKAGIKAGLGSPQMKELLIPGEDWKLVGEGYTFTEGPAANEKGELFFNDVPQAKTYKIGLDGKVTEFLKENGRCSGHAFGPDGKLYSVGGGLDPLVAFAADGTKTVVAEGVKGNDLVVLNNGSMYVTAPGSGTGSDANKILLITPQGEKKVVDTGIKFPNGITTSPDQTLLYVAESRTHWVWSFTIQKDGTLANKQKYYHLHKPDTASEASADGLKTDRDGRLWVATRMGIQVCDQAGRVNCIIPTPNGKCANLCFGGANLDIIYATCGDKVYARKVKVKGTNPYQKPFKPAPPRL